MTTKTPEGLVRLRSEQLANAFATNIVISVTDKAPRDNEYGETLWWIGHSSFYSYVKEAYLSGFKAAQDLMQEELKEAHHWGYDAAYPKGSEANSLEFEENRDLSFAEFLKSRENKL